MRWHEEQPRKTWASFVVTATIASQLGEGSELQASLPTSAFSPPNWASSVKCRSQRTTPPLPAAARFTHCDPSSPGTRNAPSASPWPTARPRRPRPPCSLCPSSRCGLLAAPRTHSAPAYLRASDVPSTGTAPVPDLYLLLTFPVCTPTSPPERHAVALCHPRSHSPHPRLPRSLALRRSH